MKCELVARFCTHQSSVSRRTHDRTRCGITTQHPAILENVQQEKKTTIILTSHYMEDVEALCERVVIINHGALMYDGSLQQLLDKYIDHKILEVTFTEPVEKKS